MKTGIVFVVSFLFTVQGSWALSIAPETPVATHASVIVIFALCILIILLLGLLFFLYYLNTALRVMFAADNKQEKPLFDFTGAVPVDREHEILMDHSYDGIRELDNNLPTWWVYLFYATIIFSGGYFYYYQTSGYGDTQIQEYEKSLIAAQEEMKLYASKVDENSVTILTDDMAIEEGKTLFMENCAACHGKLGEGGVGPNFADDYWLHGGDIKDVFKTVKYGIPEKGMISWQSQISPVQIQQVSSYILTLQGTNPPNGKAPQGELIQK